MDIDAGQPDEHNAGLAVLENITSLLKDPLEFGSLEDSGLALVVEASDAPPVGTDPEHAALHFIYLLVRSDFDLRLRDY